MNGLSGLSPQAAHVVAATIIGLSNLLIFGLNCLYDKTQRGKPPSSTILLPPGYQAKHEGIFKTAWKRFSASLFLIFIRNFIRKCMKWISNH